jgi:serine/threonine protein phosphatase 1
MYSSVKDNAGRVQYFTSNKVGRDFCVGDIHGMFNMLETLLGKANFDKQKDRLFSVGDLIDRGPSSLRAVEFLAQPWFHAIRGNHEDMLITCQEDPQDRTTANMWIRNGGAWWLDTTEADRVAIYVSIKPLPLAMEIETAHCRVGIVHADIPPSIEWEAFISQLEAQDLNAEQTALWSRTRAKLHKIAGDVPGIERIYCGHNIVDKPLKAGNVRYIDTGAYQPEVGRLTMIEISDPEEREISISTAELSGS